MRAQFKLVKCGQRHNVCRCDPNSDCHVNTCPFYSYTYAYSHIHTDVDPNTNSHGHQHSYAYAGSNSYPNFDSNRDVNSYASSKSYANTDANRDACRAFKPYGYCRVE